jgi:hypothetical protein
MSNIDKTILRRKRDNERRWAKRITLPGGKQVPQPTGQGRRTDLEPEAPPPIHAARAARCRIDSASPLHESDMGRCILALTEGQERADLTDTWGALSAARRNYLARVIGQTGDPQGAAIAMLPDAMETDPSLRVDLRSPSERDDAARRSWADWQARIKALPAPQLIWAIRGALDGFMGDGSLWRDGSPTAYGRSAVHALKLLTERG